MKRKNTLTHLNACLIHTALGSMIALADKQALHMLVFIDHDNHEQEIEKLQQKINAPIIFADIAPLCSIQKELAAYFAGTLKTFTTVVYFAGTSFQHQAWQILQSIEYGTTWSYKQEAITLDKPSASRAVGTANSCNPLAIIIPCHRVIQSNGNLGGYAYGIERKKWLLNHEKNNID